MGKEFSIYIISHNRPNCDTYFKLRKLGFIGNIIVIIDYTDKHIETYKSLYKDKLRIFDKDKIKIDLMDNFNEPKGIATYAREYCMQLSKEENQDYILMLDDDLIDIKYRYGKSGQKCIKNINDVFNECIEFMENSNIDILTFGSQNDYIGGKSKEFNIGRGTNAYLIKTKSNIHFRGRYSEDRIMPIYYSMLGKFIFKILRIQFIFNVWTPKKKKLKGGCNDIYKDGVNFLMMFYPIISNPSNTFIKKYKGVYKASTNYKYACPKIISYKYKK